MYFTAGIVKPLQLSFLLSFFPIFPNVNLGNLATSSYIFSINFCKLIKTRVNWQNNYVIDIIIRLQVNISPVSSVGRARDF